MIVKATGDRYFSERHVPQLQQRGIVFNTKLSDVRSPARRAELE